MASKHCMSCPPGLTNRSTGYEPKAIVLGNERQLSYSVLEEFHFSFFQSLAMANNDQMVPLDQQNQKSQHPLPIMDAQTQALVQLDGPLALHAGGNSLPAIQNAGGTTFFSPLMRGGTRDRLHLTQKLITVWKLQP